MLPMITCIKLTILQLVNMEPVVPLASFSRIVHPSSLSASTGATGAESILRKALAQKNPIDISEALTKLHYFPLPLRLFLAVNEAASSMASKSNS